MKRKMTIFFYLLFNLVINEPYASSADTSALERVAEKRYIRQLNTQDLKTLMQFCVDHGKFHQDSGERDFSALTFAKVSKSFKQANDLKCLHILDEVFGIYGCYVTKSDRSELLAGIIKMVGDSSTHNGVEGHAECEMTMHPSYRGRGIGSHFRMQFHDQVIVPILRKKITFVDRGNKEKVTFQGTMGYIHANNIASRRMVTKLGFAPVRLSFKPYFEGNVALQLMYVYPHLPESYELPCPLPQAVVDIILENSLERNSDILIKNQNHKPIILEWLEDSRVDCRNALREQNIEIPLARMFIENLKSLLPVFSKHKEQLAQEIAVLETIKQLAEENSFSANRHFVEFLQEKDIAGKRLKFKELLLNS